MPCIYRPVSPPPSRPSQPAERSRSQNDVASDDMAIDRRRSPSPPSALAAATLGSRPQSLLSTLAAQHMDSAGSGPQADVDNDSVGPPLGDNIGGCKASRARDTSAKRPEAAMMDCAVEMPIGDAESALPPPPTSPELCSHYEEFARTRRTGSPMPSGALHDRVLAIHKVKQRRHFKRRQLQEYGAAGDSVGEAGCTMSAPPPHMDMVVTAPSDSTIVISSAPYRVGDAAAVGGGAGSLLCRSPPSDSVSSRVYLAMSGRDAGDAVSTSSLSSSNAAVISDASTSRPHSASSAPLTKEGRRRKRTVSSPGRSFAPPMTAAYEWSTITPSPLGAKFDTLPDWVDKMSLQKNDSADVDDTCMEPSIRRPGLSVQTDFGSHRSSPSISSATAINGELYGSFLGTYEESILNGRLSTPPSRPLSFVCQVGVIGLEAKCPQALRCPPHVTIPFQASFYEWNRNSSTPAATDASATININGASIQSPPISQQQPSNQSSQPVASTDAPAASVKQPSTETSFNMTEELGTPYVGTVDLEWGLGPQNNYGYASAAASCSADDKSLSSTSSSSLSGDGGSLYGAGNLPSYRSLSDPPGYLRLPLKGRLQLMIRNLHRVVVKMFMVPYDFTAMPVHTRTFIRQKTFLRPDQQSLSDRRRDNGVGSLRHAVHLSFICLPTGSGGRSRGHRSSYSVGSGVSFAKSSRSSGGDAIASGTTPTLALSSSVGAAEDQLTAAMAMSDKRRSAQRPAQQKTLQKALYLHKSIRVVFGHRVVEAEKDRGERVEVVAEGPHGRWMSEYADSERQPTPEQMYPRAVGPPIK